MGVGTAIDRESGTKRRWRIPPPLLQDGQGPGPEGLSVLGEFRNELGAVLWKSLRSVLVWADTKPASRPELFDSEAADRRQLEILAAVPEDEEALREPLEDLLPLLARPGRADGEFTGIACNRIAAWAEGQGAIQTQLEFLQAAAVACPANGGYALAVGRVARDLTQYGRAEAWMYRAVGLARQAQDWECYVRSYLSHGIMMFRRGALPSARRSYLKALRRSRRQGLRNPEGRALHNLFTLEHRAGDAVSSMKYAGEAVEAHLPAHENLPRLAHDIAYAWLEVGHYGHALPIFLETLPRMRVVDRPFVLGSIGRAAAGAGDSGAYQWARIQLESQKPAPGVAEAWIDMARAALTLEHPEEAEESARLAEAVARERREGQMRFMAEEILGRIEAERMEATAAEAGYGATREPSQGSDELARSLLRGLQAMPAAELEPAGA